MARNTENDRAGGDTISHAEEEREESSQWLLSQNICDGLVREETYMILHYISK